MKEYKKRLLQIAVPILLSNLISNIQMLIDRIFLGRLDVLYVSAVGNATAPIWTSMSIVYSLGMGASILISQSVGEGKCRLFRRRRCCFSPRAAAMPSGHSTRRNQR